MAGPTSGPCASWATPADLDACHTSTATNAQKLTALAAASDLLWRWSGYRYGGVCEETVRPCAQNSSLLGQYGSRDFPYGWGYSGWWAWSPAWGSCVCQANVHRACGCTMLSEVRLGRAPIVAIVNVKVDGVALVAGTDYRVDDYEWLVGLGGRTWPCCQDLSLDDTHQGTWSVDFTWGRLPPPSGVTACLDLAQILINDCLNGSCTIPERAQQIQRQGTTVTLISPERYGRDQLGNMRVGIRSVDLFLSSQPQGRPGLIVSPDIDGDVRRVNT